MSTTSPELLSCLGIAAAMFLSSAGACFASAQAGLFAMKQTQLKKLGFAPIIISGVLAIYGTIIAVLLQGKLTTQETVTTQEGYRYLAAGLAVGCACLSSGLGIAKFLSEHQKSSEPLRVQPVGEGSEPLIRGDGTGALPARSFFRLLVVLTFLEAIGLYGLVVGLFLIGK